MNRLLLSDPQRGRAEDQVYARLPRATITPDQLAELVEQKLTQWQLADHGEPAADKIVLQSFGADESLCLLIPDDDEDGYASSTFSQVLVISPKPSVASFSGVLLRRTDSEWTMHPGVMGLNEVSDPDCFVVRAKWLRLLCDLVRKEVAPLFQFLFGEVFWVSGQIFSEASVFCERFIHKGPEWFFSDKNDAALWVISSAWDRWDKLCCDENARFEELATTLSQPITLSGFRDLCVANGLAISKKRSNRKRGHVRAALESQTPCVSADSGESPYNLKKEAEKAIQSLNQYDEWDFSYGGDADLSFDFDSLILGTAPSRGDLKSVSDLKSRLWWWRRTSEGEGDEAWPKKLRELFSDNWQWSAFLYEYRARQNPELRWDFGKPWVKLNSAQRGVLTCLWPMAHVGPKTLQRRVHEVVLQQMPDRIRINLQVDLNIPDEHIAKLVLEKVRSERAKRSIPQPSHSARRSKAPSWQALQLLDRRNFLGEKLSSSERSTIAKVNAEYMKSCNEKHIVIPSFVAMDDGG